MGRPATDKKARLIEAAMRRFHRDGVAGSSLAAVANDAGVPPGNVFYYFRSKDLLTQEVIDGWCARVKDSLEALETRADPRERLRIFVSNAGERRQNYADFGCPLAALTTDLRNAPSAIVANSGQPLALLRAWLNAQFVALTDPHSASGLADFCMASLQGSFSLAHATSDPAIVSRTVDQLLKWIDMVGLDRA
ncbi:MAG: TetR/AcrR family transcriptional regulator [Sphingomonas bacterium]|nr:TetR/AcrR family transcriptional regulator [Sphingomonas bacterium]